MSAHTNMSPFECSYIHLCFILAECRHKSSAIYKLRPEVLGLLFHGILQEAATSNFAGIKNCLTSPSPQKKTKKQKTVVTYYRNFVFPVQINIRKISEDRVIFHR